ncbi:uncharacterized protein LOC107263411 isoform X2 [Cephus cinctus]|uniref:Uncharacterized protein LOC107263411 isoform X2 n=1 Tax=Cephus cinctus TaxID=211228 RepID=A0AAJ7BHC0_CEPCN|nr:uncharacterized protein LOC107263411 isoform X2 [Cephus cinctus]
MFVRKSFFFLAKLIIVCTVSIALAQFSNEDIDAQPQRALGQGSTGPGRPGRLQRLQAGRLQPNAQPVLGNQRVRRPLAFRPRQSASEEPEIPAFPGVRGPRPGPSGIDNENPIPLVRPLQSAPPTPQQVKPVNEESEEDDNVAQVIANLGAVSNIGHQSGEIFSTLAPQAQPAPVQYRPSLPVARPAPLPEQSITPVQYRPQKPVRPKKPIEDLEIRAPIKQQRVQQTQPRPVAQDNYEPREKKPVAQVIRRYREDNPDGSITWGFENDDGSYKEELIGVDCITRGKYGYIDPDGMRREYTYETGIRCSEQQQEDDKQNGFVDYQENKLVLPGGQTIDLSSMGKKQTRRPQPYRN